MLNLPWIIHPFIKTIMCIWLFILNLNTLLMYHLWRIELLIWSHLLSICWVLLLHLLHIDFLSAKSLLLILTDHILDRAVQYHIVFESLDVGIDLIIIIVKYWSEIVSVLWLITRLAWFHWFGWSLFLWLLALTVSWLARLLIAGPLWAWSYVWSIRRMLSKVLNMRGSLRWFAGSVHRIRHWRLVMRRGSVGLLFLFLMNELIVMVHIKKISWFWTEPAYRCIHASWLSLVFVAWWLIISIVFILLTSDWICYGGFDIVIAYLIWFGTPMQLVVLFLHLIQFFLQSILFI